MWPVPAGWAAALAASHTTTTRAESWSGTARLGAVTIASGSVQISARNRVRRTLNLTVPETSWPTAATDPLSPYAAELRVYCTVAGLPEIPVFRGRVQTVERTYKSGQVRVTAADRFADINADQFEWPRAAPAGTLITAAIADLISESLPDAAVTSTATATAVVPLGLSWDRDRGQAIDGLATSVGVEVVCNPIGNFLIRAVPTIDGATAVWALTDGTAGTVVTDVQSQSREGVANVIVALGEQASGLVPVRAVVHDLNPASPTMWGGPFGKAVRFYSSPFIADPDQATAAATAILARTVGITRQRDITCVPNPALDAGDVITISVGGVLETHIADELTLPLTVDGGPMQIRTRSSRNDPAGLT